MSKSIKTLRSDREGDYLSIEFTQFLKDNGILAQLTPPNTSQMNGVSERRNHTLLDMVRSMMSFSKLPISLWRYAHETPVRVLKVLPRKSVGSTPYGNERSQISLTLEYGVIQLILGNMMQVS